LLPAGRAGAWRLPACASASSGDGSLRKPMSGVGLMEGANAEDRTMSWFRAFCFVGTIVLVGVLLIFLQGILVPFTFAIFLAYLVRPFSEFISLNLCSCCRSQKAIGDAEMATRDDTAMRRITMVANTAVQQTVPRWVGVLLALLLAFFMIAIAVTAVYVSLDSVAPLLPRYQSRAIGIWADILNWIKTLGLGDLNDIRDLPSRMVRVSLSPIVAVTTSIASDFMLVVVFLVFLLLEPPAQQSSLRKKIDDSVSRYIILKSSVCVIVSVIVYGILMSVQFPLALAIALLTFLLTYVPNIGPIVATCLPIPICVLDVNVNSAQKVVVILGPLLTHLLMGNFIEPQLFGQQFSMSPVILLFSLGLWFIVWGLAGAVLAVPLTSILRIVCRYLMTNDVGLPYTAMFVQIIEGRPMDFDLPSEGRAESVAAIEDENTPRGGLFSSLFKKTT